MTTILDLFQTCVFIHGKFPYPKDTDPVEFKIKRKAFRSIDYRLMKINTEKNYEPKPKDRLYFYPGCNVPRHKVREWAKDKKISITIKEDQATAKFASDKSIKACINNSYYSSMDKVEFLEWLELNYPGDMRFDSLKLAIKDSESNVVTWDRGSINNDVTCDGWKATLHSDLVKGLSQYNSYNRWCYDSHVNAEDWPKLEGLVNSTDIYDQEKLVSLISDDSVTIDVEMYQTLRGMFQGTNEDKVLALEIVANCNYDPSLHHILLLCREFGHVMMGLKQSKHVNFKSLIKYLNIGDIRHISDDVMVECLMSKDVLTMDILTELCNGVKTQWSQDKNSKYFLVNSITVSDEVKNYFKNKEAQETQVLESEETEA